VERCCGACGAELTKIREEVTEQLDYTPASFKIIEHVRGVFACKGCEECSATITAVQWRQQHLCNLSSA
jgi:transposase